MSFEDQIAAAIPMSAADGVADAARWRGQCVDYYARIEFLVGISLRELWKNGHKPPPQPLYTYRTKIAALRDALAEGSFSPYARLHRALNQLHTDCDRRNLIVHASGTVGETPAGDWVWTGCYIPAEAPDMVAKVITRAEAEVMETGLKRTIQSLSSQLARISRRAVTN
jgi:hypothetical protein